MVTPSESLRNLSRHHRVSDGRGIRHWVLLVSVFLADLKYAALSALERALVWSAHQLPSDSAVFVAEKYRIRDNRW